MAVREWCINTAAVDIATNPTITRFASEWEPTTARTFSGIMLFGWVAALAWFTSASLVSAKKSPYRPHIDPAEFQTTIQLAPDSPMGHFGFGYSLGRTGRRAEALAHFREALRLKPDNQAAKSNLDWALSHKP
jgi:tetratricopeptide (TPR) repeat protein